jgi:hypothetical protein
VISRVGLLPEKQTEAAIKDIVTVGREFKNRQKFSAKSGLLGYLTESADQWDLHETLSGNGTIIITVTFTGDGSQKYPFIQPYADLFFGGTSDSNRPDDVSLEWVSGMNLAILGDFLLFDTTYASDELVYAWITIVNYSGTFDYYLKAYAMGSSLGTLSVTRIFE